MLKKNNVVIGIQCRLRSKRLPAKALLKMGNESILGFLLKRAISFNLPVFLLTSDQESDNLIESESKKFQIAGIIRGSEEDVLERYVYLQRLTKADIIVRVTADNPLTDFRFIPLLVEYLLDKKLDYCTIDNRVCLEGTNVEIFTSRILSQSFKEDKSSLNKENVTTFMKEKSPKCSRLETMLQTKEIPLNNIKKYSVTIDTINDFIKVKNLLNEIEYSLKSEIDIELVDKCLKLINSDKYHFPFGRNHKL